MSVCFFVFHFAGNVARFMKIVLSRGRAAMKRSAAEMEKEEEEEEEGKSDAVTFTQPEIDANLARHAAYLARHLELKQAGVAALQNAMEELESMLEGLQHLQRATQQLQAFLPTCGTAQEGYTLGLKEQTDKLNDMSLEAKRTMCSLVRVRTICQHGDEYRDGGEPWMLGRREVLEWAPWTEAWRDA